MEKIIFLSPKDSVMRELFFEKCGEDLKKYKDKFSEYNISFSSVSVDIKNIPDDILDKLEELNPILIVPIGLDLAKIFDPDISFIKDKEIFYINKTIIIPVFTEIRLETFINSIYKVIVKYKSILDEGVLINE